VGKENERHAYKFVFMGHQTSNWAVVKVQNGLVISGEFRELLP